MKKLKIKIFLIIFSILSFFLFGVFVISNAREYSITRRNINNILSRRQEPKSDIKVRVNNSPKEIFLDYTIYTVLLDNNGKYFDFN